MRKDHLIPALRVALIYAGASALWIALSDRLLYLAVQDPARITALQTYKGWAFVAASAALIYALLRRELAAQARAAERQRRVLEAAAEGICGLDPEGKVTCANPAAAQITGYAVEELLGRRLHDLVHHTRADGTPFPWEECSACHTLVRGEVYAGIETLFWRRDGSAFEAEVSCAPVREGQLVVGAVVAFRDVSARRRMEERLARLARLHRLLAGVGHAVVTTRDRDELLREVCRLAVELGSFRLAWIGLVRDDLDYVAPVARWGDEEGYLEEARVAARDVPLGRGPTGTAVREGRPVVCQDIARDPRMEPWRAPALRRGYRSSAALPLRSGPRVVGALSLYAAEPGFFDEETVQLLARLADEVSLALGALEYAERSRRAEERLAYLATHDPLTGLPNRYVLEQALERATRRVGPDRPASLLLLEVDRLGTVVGAAGHAGEDLVLGAVAGLLQESSPPGCLVARMADRQFAVLLEQCGPEEARAWAEHLRRTVEGRPFEAEGREFWLTVSGGLTVLEGPEAPATALTRAAAALRAAARGGGNRIVAFRPGDDAFAEPAEAERLARRIREVLERSLLALFIQPIVDLREGRVLHYEALLRLQEEDGRFVPAGELIPVAEGTGLMPRIERWVVRSALELLRARPELSLFVNLSGASLGDEELLDFIAREVRAAGIHPSRLGFEITETAAVRDLVRAERWLGRLKALGCSLALDDFGAGFSSFAYLRALPVDYLKIDGAYVRDVDRDPTHRALVQAMSTVARALGKKTVAEWVESAAVAEALRGLGVDCGQGLLLRPPRAALEETFRAASVPRRVGPPSTGGGQEPPARGAKAIMITTICRAGGGEVGHVWPAREAVDAWHLVSRAVHLAVVGFLTVYLFLFSPLWRESSWSWALGLVGAGLWFLGAAVHLAEELFGIPQALHHWGEDVPLTLGPLLVAVRMAVLLPRLHADAHLDPLTGLLNRRGVERALRRELARARRHGLPLAVLFGDVGDVDGLKEINDARGHRAGDTLLRLVAGCLRANLRETDAAGRWGGDEFVVLLPHTDAAGAEVAMRRLRAACAAVPDVLGFPVNVSYGAACYPQDGTRMEELLAAADRRMYEAKRRGRGGHPPGGVRAGPADPPEGGARAPGEP